MRCNKSVLCKKSTQVDQSTRHCIPERGILRCHSSVNFKSDVWMLMPCLGSLTAFFVSWSELLATDPEVRVRFPALPDFLGISGSGTGPSQSQEYNWRATWKKNSGSGLETREYCRRDPSRWPRSTLKLQKLALISPTSGGRSVGIVHSWTQATEFSLGWLMLFVCITLLVCQQFLWSAMRNTCNYSYMHIQRGVSSNVNTIHDYRYISIYSCNTYLVRVYMYTTWDLLCWIW
jgi:hypothetical protein